MSLPSPTAGQRAQRSVGEHAFQFGWCLVGAKDTVLREACKPELQEELRRLEKMSTYMLNFRVCEEGEEDNTGPTYTDWSRKTRYLFTPDMPPNKFPILSKISMALPETCSFLTRDVHGEVNKQVDTDAFCVLWTVRKVHFTCVGVVGLWAVHHNLVVLFDTHRSSIANTSPILLYLPHQQDSSRGACTVGPHRRGDGLSDAGPFRVRVVLLLQPRRTGDSPWYVIFCRSYGVVCE